MLLGDIFEQLTQGELRHLALGGVDSGGILEHNYDKIIPHINLGVTELCKRFPIMNHVAQILTTPETPIYNISDFTTDNVLKVETVNGAEAEMYDYNHIYYLTSDTSFEVVFRAGPVSIPSHGQTPATPVELPSVYMEALLYYIAMRVTSSDTVEQGQMPVSTQYQQKFEQACAKLHEMGLTVTRDRPVNKIKLNGWV